MTLVNAIKRCIEEQVSQGKRKFIIFPFGDVGIRIKSILESAYNIRPQYIIDSHLSKFNEKIYPLSFLEGIKETDYMVILACVREEKKAELKELLLRVLKENQIMEIPYIYKQESKKKIHFPPTVIGKYSYGPICRNHEAIERIGNFCSFAMGTDCVGDHPKEYITTHPLISGGGNFIGVEAPYLAFQEETFFFPGVLPHKDKITYHKRSIIGNDVWLGRNVLIINGARIGNGVIAGAGTIITKDIPDYAVVVGAPARIVRYRYLPDQIEALNRICWWNWSDEEIRERYADFYLPIEKFIEKYDV